MKTYKLKNIQVSKEEILNLIKENPELKGDAPSGKRWRAEYDEKYWCVGTNGYIHDTLDMNSPYDDICYETGNYYKTEEEAETIGLRKLERQNAVQAVWDYVNENGLQFEPDWEDADQIKCFVGFNYASKRFDYAWFWNRQFQSELPHFKSGQDAQQVIDNMEKELKIIFGVEDK